MDTSNNKKPQDLNKTFVEGDDLKTGVHSVQGQSRIDATRIRGTNPYAAAAAAAAPASNLPSGNEPIPLGSGTVVGLLGSGGMARVYKIWNEKLEVFRAVKILIPNQQGDMRNRFETEAKITAKLHHTNIVEVYAVGDWQGLPYLEMELIDGRSLEAVIAQTGKLPPAVCSAISIFVIRALAYAHGQEFLIYGKTYQGIIHRDLKPANIMISSSGALKLMDFGIARPTEASLHTVDGNIVGTMQYLSPEQMDGVDIDSRADIYAFGAILYEMLTGTKTFPQETITNLMKQKIMNEYRKFDDFNFSIPSGLAKVSQKCLQLAKENRFANANLLLKELETVHRAISSDPPEVVLKSFINDPSSIKHAARKKLPIKINLKILIPVAAVLLIGGLVTVFLLTGPKPAATTETAQGTAQDTAVQKVVVQTPPPPHETPPDTLISQSVQQTRFSASEGKTSPLQGHQQKTGDQIRRPPNVDQKKKNNTNAQKNPFETGEGRKNGAPQGTAVKDEPSPLSRLESLYESSDYFTIGKLALQKSAYADAIMALTAIPADHPNHEKAVLLLLNAYIESGRTQDALSIIRNESINDAEYFFLSGRASMKQGRDKEAVDLFQAALTKPCSVRNINDVRMDALYFTALAYRDIYANDPSSDNRGLTLQAWLVVKNTYRNNPNHPRFKKAVEEMANIK
jgi:eukaryotic-like serine/threonine-protein kinase